MTIFLALSNRPDTQNNQVICCQMRVFFICIIKFQSYFFFHLRTNIIDTSNDIVYIGKLTVSVTSIGWIIAGSLSSFS